MIIDKVYEMVRQLSNKEELSGYISPSEFNRYAELAQLDWLQENYNPATKMGYENNYQSTASFAGFKKVSSITVTNGIVTKPDDYLYYDSAYCYGEYGDKGRMIPIELLRNVEWAESMMSEINKPTKHFPKMRSLDGEFEVAPSSLSQVVLNYIKVPLQPWWNYTVSGTTLTFVETGGSTTNPNTGSGTSTDFTLDESEIPWLVNKICGYFGIEVQDQLLYQAVKNEIKTED